MWAGVSFFMLTRLGRTAAIVLAFMAAKLAHPDKHSAPRHRFGSSPPPRMQAAGAATSDAINPAEAGVQLCAIPDTLGQSSAQALASFFTLSAGGHQMP